jgi:hypothetical protein
VMKEDTQERESCVFAALETGARLRGHEASPGREPSDAVEQTVATIEAESARIKAHDLSAVEAVFTSQALALDTLFVQLLRGSTYDAKLWPDPLRFALKAQSQSRVTLSTLLSLIHARSKAAAADARRPVLPGPTGEAGNSGEQTAANGNCPK